jgi:hypothetical protein
MNITLTREEAQQILDALNSCGEDWVADGEWETRVDDYDHELVAKAKKLFSAKLAKPEREWQGLTDEEIDMALWENESNYLPDIIRIAEAKLKGKNR